MCEHNPRGEQTKVINRQFPEEKREMLISTH